MFLSQDPRTQQMYGDAFKWIAESDNKEAISNLTDDFVKKVDELYYAKEIEIMKV